MSGEAEISRMERALTPLHMVVEPPGQDPTPEQVDEWMMEVSEVCQTDIATHQASDALQGALLHLVRGMDERTATLIILRETLRETVELKARLIQFVNTDNKRIIVPGAHALAEALGRRN